MIMVFILLTVCRSISLLLQAVLPCLHFAAGPTECHLIGGTNADLAPPIDYFEKVALSVIGIVCDYSSLLGVFADCFQIWSQI